MLLFLFGCCSVGSTAVSAQTISPIQGKETTRQQLIGCWTNVSQPSSKICFESDGKLLFTNEEADKTIKRTWKLLPNGLIRIKFISLFRPKYRIENVTKQYLKLVPVNKGVVIELQR